MNFFNVCISLATLFPIYPVHGKVVDITQNRASGLYERRDTLAEVSDSSTSSVEAFGAHSADDELWEKVKCKGGNLLKMMKGDKKEAGALLSPPLEDATSAFEDFPREFDKWGYVREENDDDIECDMEFIGLDKALNGLGVSDKNKEAGGPIKCWDIQHSKDVTVDSKTYKATGAKYFFGFNADDGVLIGMSLYSPAHMGRSKSPPVDQLPDLRQSSDIMWGQWRLHAGARASQIKYYIINAITNSDTGPVIQRAVESGKVAPLKKWPGASFGMETDEGKALLGTPVGVGVGFLLAQHKAQLGNKVISKVDVFLPEEGGNPSLAFHVG